MMVENRPVDSVSPLGAVLRAAPRGDSDAAQSSEDRFPAEKRNQRACQPSMGDSSRKNGLSKKPEKKAAHSETSWNHNQNFSHAIKAPVHFK